MKGYRTFLLNLVAMVLPILDMTEVVNMIPADYTAHYIITLALANGVMRVLTTTPVGKSQ